MLNSAKNFLREVVQLGLLLIAVAVVLQVIFGSAVPFVGGDIVGNLTGIITSLGDGGLVGLISVGIILYLLDRASLITTSIKLKGDIEKCLPFFVFSVMFL